MAIYYDKSKNKWKVDVWNDGKRYKSKAFEKKALAEKFERECLTEIDKSKLTGIQFQDITYRETYKAWRDNVSSRKRESSLTKDDQMNRDYVDPFIGGKLVKEITLPNFDKIIKSALDKGLMKSSVNKIIQNFKSVFNFAMKAELIPRNPSIAVTQLRFQQKEMDFYFQDELDEFLSLANDKYLDDKRLIFIFYLFLFTTGMRLGEVLGMTWDRIDFDRNQIIVNQTWNGPKSIVEKITKGKKLRVIPLPAILRNELIAWRNRKKGTKLTDLIFTFDGSKALCPSNIRRWYWDKDAEEAGVRRIRLHDARHTYGAHFMMNGGSIYKLQKLLGHESIKTTERYAHLAPDYLEGVRDMVTINISTRAEVITMKKSSLPIHSREEDIGLEDVVNV